MQGSSILLVVTRSDTEAKTGFKMILEAPPTQKHCIKAHGIPCRCNLAKCTFSQYDMVEMHSLKAEHFRITCHWYI